MTYTVLSGMWNSTILYQLCCLFADCLALITFIGTNRLEELTFMWVCVRSDAANAYCGTCDCLHDNRQWFYHAICFHCAQCNRKHCQCWLFYWVCDRVQLSSLPVTGFIVDWPVVACKLYLSLEGLRERTEHLNIFLFSTHHSMMFYFRCCVYWWKESVRF